MTSMPWCYFQMGKAASFLPLTTTTAAFQISVLIELIWKVATQNSCSLHFLHCTKTDKLVTAELVTLIRVGMTRVLHFTASICLRPPPTSGKFITENCQCVFVAMQHICRHWEFACAALRVCFSTKLCTSDIKKFLFVKRLLSWDCCLCHLAEEALEPL